MIPLSCAADEVYAVLGLGRSGLAAGRALSAAGAKVLAWDDDAGRREAARRQGVTPADPRSWEWPKLRALVLSPGIPHTHPRPHPLAAEAKARNCPIIGDVELLIRARTGAAVVGITGTNGKSTTTALVGHILSECGVAAEVGGNLGPPVLDFRPLGADGVYVLELSSYQLELAPSLDCKVAALLNLSPDHLDRHGGFQGYVDAKRRIFAGSGAAVIGADDPETRAIADEVRKAGRRRVVPISGSRAVPGGVGVADGVLIDDMDGAGRGLLDLADLSRLRGDHNHQNVAAAYAMARLSGLDPAAIVGAIKTFAGLAHRQELVATTDGVVFVNDSKATNADAAARALASFERIYWIAGGRPKDGGLAEAMGVLAQVAHAYLIGEAAQAFRVALDGHVPVTVSNDLGTAVRAAFNDARAAGGGTVLLSPACASFDQFPNFEARGDAFRALARDIVRDLARQRGAA